MNIEIRPIQENDIQGFWSALSSVVSERKFLLTLDLPVIDDSATFIRNNIANNHAEYVADLNGEIIGWADIIPKQKEAWQHIGELGIGVVKEHRNKGVGKALLKEVIDHAWSTGLERIELEVFAHNSNAVQLYKNFGFELEGTKRNGRLVDGRYEDVHIMGQCKIGNRSLKS